MKRILTVLAILSYLAAWAQDNGVHFTAGPNWSQILAKARQENKLIFVDCFTTWCGPCKAMDKDVYPDAGIGAHMDSSFIAVRVQMDSTAHDSDSTKAWYTEAHNLMSRYKISAFPTFLFFSPRGQLVDRGVGYRNVKDFAVLLQEAVDPGRQYTALVEKYRQGKMGYPSMPGLLPRARKNGDRELADSIALDYLHHYLYRLNEEELYTKERLEFMASAIPDSREKGFDIFYRHPGRVDAVMGRKGYAQQVADYILSQQVITSLFRQASAENGDPDWALIRTRIRERSTPEDADRVVFEDEVSWYSNRYRDLKPKPSGWAEGVLQLVDFAAIDKYGIDTSGLGWLNAANCIEYYILGHSMDTALLRKAVGWIGMVMQVFPGEGFSYVYGGLLYRLGHSKQGIAWQTMTLRLIEDNLLKAHKPVEGDAYYLKQRDILTAMRKGEDIRPALLKLYS